MSGIAHHTRVEKKLVLPTRSFPISSHVSISFSLSPALLSSTLVLDRLLVTIPSSPLGPAGGPSTRTLYEHCQTRPTRTRREQRRRQSRHGRSHLNQFPLSGVHCSYEPRHLFLDLDYLSCGWDPSIQKATPSSVEVAFLVVRWNAHTPLYELAIPRSCLLSCCHRSESDGSKSLETSQ